MEKEVFLRKAYEVAENKVLYFINIKDVLAKMGKEISIDNIDEANSILDYYKQKDFVDHLGFDGRFVLTSEAIDHVEQNNSSATISITDNSVHARDIVDSPIQIASSNSTQSNKSIINSKQITALEDFVNAVSEVQKSDIEASMAYPSYDVDFVLPMHIINEALEKEEYSVGKIKGALRKLKPVFKELGLAVLKSSVLIAFDVCLSQFGIPPIASIIAG